MSKTREASGKKLEERVKELEEILSLLIINLSKNNRYFLDALRDIQPAGTDTAEAAVGVVDKAEGNICPNCPPCCGEEQAREFLRGRLG